MLRVLVYDPIMERALVKAPPGTPAPPRPSQARRAAAVVATFIFSGLSHEVMIAYVMRPYTFGWSYFFLVQVRGKGGVAVLLGVALCSNNCSRVSPAATFPEGHVLDAGLLLLHAHAAHPPATRPASHPQAPLVLAEQQLRKAASGAGLRLPWLAQCLVTQCMLVACAHLFFFPPVSGFAGGGDIAHGCASMSTVLTLELAYFAAFFTDALSQHAHHTLCTPQIEQWSSTAPAIIKACADNIRGVLAAAQGVMHHVVTSGGSG